MLIESSKVEEKKKRYLQGEMWIRYLKDYDRKKVTNWKAASTLKKEGQHPEHHWNKIKQKETIPQTPRASASDQQSKFKEDIRMVKQVIHAIKVLEKHNVRTNSSKITDNTKFRKRKT